MLAGEFILEIIPARFASGDKVGNAASCVAFH